MSVSAGGSSANGIEESKTMKKSYWQIRLGVILVALSAVFYLIHYAIFRDAHHIFLYLIAYLAN